MFAPFVFAALAADPGAKLPPLPLLVFIFAAASPILAALCAWPGLRFADRAQLPMPLLRAWEAQEAAPRGVWPRIIPVALLAGGVAGVCVVVLVRVMHIPRNPGGLSARLLTVVFAASVPEIITHLFAMSGLQLLLKRTWPAILLSSALFVAIFHGGHVGNAIVTALVLGANFLLGTITGWVYSRYGFEGAMLTHAVAHLIAVGVN